LTLTNAWNMDWWMKSLFKIMKRRTFKEDEDTLDDPSNF